MFQVRVAAAVVMGCVWDASNQDSGLRGNCGVVVMVRNTRTSRMEFHLFDERQYMRRRNKSCVSHSKLAR